MNKIFKSLIGGDAYVSSEPKKKKYTVLGCEETGEVKESFSTDSQSEAEERAKKYPVANIVRRGKTISVFENGRRIKSVREAQ